MVLHRQVGGLVGVGARCGERKRCRPAGGGGRCREVARGEERRPVDDSSAAQGVEAQLRVEGDAAGVGGTARAGPGRQGREVQRVTGGTHRVGDAGGAERGRGGGRGVLQGCLHLIRPRLGVGRGQGKRDRSQAGRRCRQRNDRRVRDHPGRQRGGVLDRVRQLQLRGVRGPPGVERGVDRWRCSSGEVVARRRGGDSCAPSEAVVGLLNSGEIGLGRSQRERRDGVDGVVERGPTLKVEGRADQP